MDAAAAAEIAAKLRVLGVCAASTAITLAAAAAAAATCEPPRCALGNSMWYYYYLVLSGTFLAGMILIGASVWVSDDDPRRRRGCAGSKLLYAAAPPLIVAVVGLSLWQLYTAAAAGRVIGFHYFVSMREKQIKGRLPYHFMAAEAEVLVVAARPEAWAGAPAANRRRRLRKVASHGTTPPKNVFSGAEDGGHDWNVAASVSALEKREDWAASSGGERDKGRRTRGGETNGTVWWSLSQLQLFPKAASTRSCPKQSTASENL
ncbi:hypothetical protein [Oryza sativa Japonica Group]|uniref:Uncharacterized protein P0416D03.25 n=1 Tax=Oryza sativa subsp. japonica TaxID=39947 RepID=Q5ZDN0_ORYSJ|nr:hypothetical protein [Oryza sativa Japonica Group]